MRKSVYISLALVILMQAWVGGFWSVRSVSAEQIYPKPVQKIPASCCAASNGDGMTSPGGHRNPSPPTTPCECPDAGDDCCCLRAMAVNGGFVYGSNTSPTVQPLRESGSISPRRVVCSSQVLFMDREKISGTAPPIFKLKACYLI